MYQAKTKLSEIVRLAEKGETIYLCRRNVPVAEIKPLKQPLKKRTLEVKNPQIFYTEEFFDPLPDDLLDLFNNPSL